MANNNPNIKGAPFKPEGGRPANFSNPTNLRGRVGEGVSIKTAQPKGFVSGNDYFMCSGDKGKHTMLGKGTDKIYEARGKHLA